MSLLFRQAALEAQEFLRLTDTCTCKV